MASNPYKQNKDFEQSPNRNTFDLSFTNNLTLNFGTLYPVFCKPVIPGDYFSIRTAFALRFMPLVFPVQTRCKAYIHFFYQRNKNLWKNWQDFIAANKQHFDPTSGSTPPSGTITPPYIVNKAVNNTIGTGLLGDYLNVPTTLNGGYSGLSVPTAEYVNIDADTLNRFGFYSSSDVFSGAVFGSLSLAGLKLQFANSANSPYKPYAGGNYFGNPPTFNNNYSYMLFKYTGISKTSFSVVADPYETMNISDKITFDNDYPLFAVLFDDNMNFVDVVKANLQYYVASGETRQSPRITASFNTPINPNYRVMLILPVNSYDAPSSDGNNDLDFGVSIVDNLSEITDINGNTRYFGTSDPLNALPFRCYESIYNSFYRDHRNNPFMVNGIQEFNKYIPNDGDGLDSTNYSLYNRNWELDQFSSCVPSPQQGVAPLVGISSNGDLTSYSLDGEEQIVAKLDTDAELSSAELKSAVKSLSYSLSSLASSGISINDFRNVNAYQRWKETNIRNGLKYKDQIKARWGVNIKESLLDMPEFIGGVSCDVDVNTVSSTVENENAPLGAYAGQMTAFGKSQNRISQYCDDYGYIMAIISVVPTPVYSQTLPKDFTKFSPLDYYSPEFAHIGMQPVPYKELVPIASMSPNSDIEKGETFGYQRPWYDYLSSNDEAHGLFRTSLQRFLLSRVFKFKPLLNSSFTTINNSELTNVFATDTGDKILGQIYFDVEAKRPIPRVSVPSIQ